MSTNPFDEFRRAQPANPFDEFRRAQPANPFDEFQRAGPPINQVLKTAVGMKPDDVAEAERLSKRYPAPVGVLVRNLDKMRPQAEADALGDALRSSPILAERFRVNPYVAAMARDDVPTLAKIESNFAQVAAASAGQAVLGISEGIWRTPDAAQRAVGYLAETVEKTGLPWYLNPIRGVQDVIRFVSEGRVPGVGARLGGGTTQIADQVNEAQKVLTDRETFGNPFADVQTLSKNADQALQTAIKTGNLQQVAQVVTDPNYWSAFLSQAVPSLYLAIKSGGSVAFMGWLEGMEQASNAAEFEQKTGIKISDADFTQAVAQTAIVNALLEKYGLDKVLGSRGNGLKGVAKAMGAEGGTEALQQINSNLSALLAYNPDQSLSEGVLQSLMGGVGSGGAVSAAQQAGVVIQAQLEKRAQQVEAAQKNSDQLQQALKDAGTSLLRQRSPEQFRELMQSMTDGQVYVDGQVLNQLPPEVLNQLPEAVREQIPTAAAISDTVAIPVADVLTIAPGTPLEQVIVENARTDPTQMSKVEAEAASQRAGEFLQQEAERVIAQAQDQEALRQSQEAVKQNIRQQLAATGRFRDSVNEGYATWAAAFYTAYGSRLGMTPEQFYQRYPLRVLGAPSAQGGQVIEQQKPGQLDGVEAYHWSMAARPTLSSAFYGTGLRGSARDEIMSYPDQRVRQRLSFYVDKGTGVRPEAGVGGVAHRVRLNNIYDANLDPLKLRGGNAREFESRVLDAGFDGYLDRLEGTQPGQVIMLGERTLQPEVLGPLSRVDSGQRVPALARREAPWQTQDSGTPEQLQARLERMQSSPAWGDYDLRIEGSELQVRKRAGVYEQKAKEPDSNVKLPKKASATTAVDLRSGPRLTGSQKMSIHEVAAFFDKITGKRDFNDPKEKKRAVKQIVAELQYQLRQEKSGLDWYEEDIKVAFEETAKVTPSLAESATKRQLFAVVAGLQSPGTLADLNWDIAAQTFQHYEKTGIIPGRNPANGNLWAGGPVSANKEKALKFLNAMVQDLGEQNTVEWLYSEHTVKELNEARRKWGNMGPGVDGKASDLKLGMFAFGPKVGPFVMNINGIHELTVDVWATRSFNRYFGQMTGPDGKIVDAPTEPQRRVVKELFNAAAEQVGIKPYQVQSVLWFFEQQLFNHLGTGSASLSFSDGARKFAERSLSAPGRDGGPATLQQGDLSGRPQPAGDGAGRYSSGSLAPLEGAPTVAGAAGPDPRLVAVAEQYARDNGIPLRRQAAYAVVDPERAARIAAAYEAMPHAPQDPAVREAYDDLARQTMAQYQALVAAGYQFWFMDPAADPYQGNPWNAMRDLRANQSMAVFPTESGFGTSEFDPAGNPLLADTGLEWAYGAPDGQPKRVLFNDLFRAVHDAFGHGLEGAGFRAQGEENAWQAHVRLFTGPAVGAITSETRGQNSWLNYGPYGEQNQKAKVEDTIFADQKTGLMPEWTWTEGRVEDEQAAAGDTLEQSARGTFNPQTLELVLNPNADLSTWFHETGHFFLEVLADVASQPGAPAQITEDYNKVLAWFGVTPEQWAGFSLDEKRPYHERWAESIEQYVIEGRAPSVELAPLMRRFSAWLKSVYGSIKQFLASRGQAAGGGEVLGQSANAAQPDLFPGEFATKRTTVETSMVVDSKGTRAKGGNTNSKGQQVTATKQGLQRFWNWFAGSEATDDKGRPLVLYHSTNSDVTQFETNRETANSYGILGEMTVRRAGIFLTPDLKFSQEYLRDGSGQNVMQVYAALKNPLDLRKGLTVFDEQTLEAAGVSTRFVRNVQNYWELFDSADDGANDFVDGLKAAGYDGAIFREDSPGGESEGGTTYVAFESNQVKSATGNRGTFDANDPSILSQDPNAPAGPPMQLNDDIRRVMDRMLATDEQIAQANEVAGLMPDEEADGEAAERLQKRSMADLKWAVKARDKVIAKLRKQAAAIEKDIREQVTAEVDATPEMMAKRAMDALKITPEYEGILRVYTEERANVERAERDRLVAALYEANPDVKGLKRGQLLAKNRREINNKVDAFMIEWDRANPKPARPYAGTDQDVAVIADSFGFESVDAMLQAIDAFGSRQEAIDGLTERRMLEEHGDLIDERAIQEAANEAVHNEARARSLATELRTQAEMLNRREDTGQVNAKGSKITVNALVEAAKQFAANVVGRTPLGDLKAKAWQHTAAERRAAKRWTEATAAGDTQAAVQAKQDQMLNHAAAKAALDAQAEAKKILDFFKRVTKGNDEKVVEKGRDPDIVNAARAVLAAYGVETPASRGAAAYLETLKTNDPDTYAALEPMVAAATQNAQPLEALTFEELQGLSEAVQAMWFLAKRSRQMEVDGNLLDIDDAAQDLFARMEVIGIPDRVPGEGMAVTKEEERGLFLKQGIAFLRRVEQWAEGMDGKYGGPFLRLVFQPIKAAADRYRKDRIAYRKRFQALVDNLAPIVGDSVIQAPELGYTFGTPGSTAGTAMNEILHAIAHTGNESNKRKLLLGRGWATENPDGTLDTSRWDAFIRRLVNEGKLERAHYDFVQGVWDLLEDTKPLAQKAHRDAFGRYFSEVTADTFVDPFGVTRRGGYIPAQVDSRLVKDNALRKLAEEENNSMAFAFPQPAKGFTMARTEYNRPLLLDLRGLSQHIDKVLLFGHMTNPARDVRKLLTRKTVSQPLDRIQPAAIESMLQPWLQRSAQQIVEDPIVGGGKWARLPGIIRSRAGMALMFANVSNTLQQITGLSTAAVRVKPGFLMRSLAQYVASPVKFSRAVWDTSPYMDDRAKNEVAFMNEQMQAILMKPSVYDRAQDWSLRHAYFLQTAFDNVLSPIVWTGAYNQALADGMSEADAVRFADGTVRQTQGSTLPEDVSRFETGPAYARAFTQFVSYFNMMANTNGTALKQIANEVGLKKGAGKALYVVMMGFMIPIWVAEAIALAFRGGPEDEDEDGYLDDWLASVFGMGTLKGLLAQIPILGQFGVAAANRFNDNPLDDRVSLSPAISLLESSVSAPQSVYKAITDEGSAQKAVRDVATLVSVATGIPVYALARPAGYLAGVEDDRIVPTSEIDFARGLVTGTASPDSRQR